MAKSSSRVWRESQQQSRVRRINKKRMRGGKALYVMGVVRKKYLMVSQHRLGIEETRLEKAQSTENSG